MKRKAVCILLVLSLLLSVLAFSGCANQQDPQNSTETEPEIVPVIFDLSEEENIEQIDIDKYWEEGIVSPNIELDISRCAQGANSLRIGAQEDYNEKVTLYFGGLPQGYYYLEAKTLNEGNQEFCYVYGKGSRQGECATAVPRTTKENTWSVVTVRGIEVGEDGLLELGVSSKGCGQFVNFDSFKLGYEKDQTNRYESLFGGAVSWLDWVEDLGGKYYRRDGSEADALQIMAENGCNIVRLELYNNPGDYINEYGDMFPKGYKDADAIFDLAVRAHNKGMKIQLSFMYADYWGNEAIPSDWMSKIEGISDEQKISEILTDCLYEYTKGFMLRLAEAGIYPEYVSLGNEMSGGILEPYGSSWRSAQTLQTFCSLMNAGYNAVKEVSPSSKIVLHIASNADDMFWENKSGSGNWFYALCDENGVKYDVIGISYYPFWAQTDSIYAVKPALDTSDLVEWCNMMIDRFDKDIIIMESGINWGTPGQLANNGAYEGIYKYTPNDQRDFMIELINAIKTVKDGRCIGDLYWDPVLVRQEGIGWAIMSATNTSRENCVETTTFFDYDHIALPVLDAYKYNISGSSQAVLFGKIIGSKGVPLAESSVKISFNGKEYTVTTDKYGDYYLSVDAAEGRLWAENSEEIDLSLEYGERKKLDINLK